MWRKRASNKVERLPEERKVLAERYTIDADEAQRREQRAAEEEARRQAAAEEAARRAAAEEAARRAVDGVPAHSGAAAAVL